MVNSPSEYAYDHLSSNDIGLTKNNEDLWLDDLNDVTHHVIKSLFLNIRLGVANVTHSDQSNGELQTKLSLYIERTTDITY